MTKFPNENEGRGLENETAWLAEGSPHKLSNKFSNSAESGQYKSGVANQYLNNTLPLKLRNKRPKIDRYTKIKDLIEFAENLVGKECIVKEDSVLAHENRLK